VSAAVAYHPEPGSLAPRSRPRISNSALLAGACSVLLFLPLAFGAVQAWAILLLQASAVALVLAWGFRQWSGRELDFVRHPLYAPMLAFLALGLLQWAAGFTAYRHATYSHLLLYSAYGMLVFVITQSLRRSAQLKPLVWIVCGYGALVASFALLQGIAPNGKLYWIFPLHQGGLLYGPYVNHNHYAGFMEMLTPFPLAVAASRFARGNLRLLAAAVGALMAGTIFLSASRGGMIAFGAQVVVLVLLLSPQRRNWKRSTALAVFLVVMVGFLVWLGGSALTQRLVSIQSETRQELSGGVRLTIDRDGLRMWREKPWLGWGLGTFPVAYPEFRSFYTRFFVNQAHNDYLQLLVESGLAGCALALWFLVVTFRGARAKLENWTENAGGTLTAAALVGVVGLLVHSALDFNLQIPANAALFYVLCAIAAAAPLRETQRIRHVRRHHNLILDPRPDLTPRPETP